MAQPLSASTITIELSSPNDTRSIKLQPGQSITLGRASRSKGNLPSPNNALYYCSVMSHAHAELRVSHTGAITIRDLQSTHGTFVDDQELLVGVAYELKHRQEITLGRSIYTATGGSHTPMKVTAIFSPPKALTPPSRNSVLAAIPLTPPPNNLAPISKALAPLSKDPAPVSVLQGPVSTTPDSTASAPPARVSGLEQAMQTLANKHDQYDNEATPGYDLEQGASRSASPASAKGRDVGAAATRSPAVVSLCTHKVLPEPADPAMGMVQQPHCNNDVSTKNKKRNASLLDEQLVLQDHHADDGRNSTVPNTDSSPPSKRARIAILETKKTAVDTFAEALRMTACAVAGSVLTVGFLCSPLADHLLQ